MDSKKELEKKVKDISNDDLTPLMRQYKEMKLKNPDALLLFRCGDFFESYFEDASILSRDAGITLTFRSKEAENPIPMAGVPYKSVNGYIAKLIQKGHTISICDQIEDPKFAKGLVKREITRIITPGTITELNMLDESTNNYLSAFGSVNDRFCLISADISTGEVIMTSGDKSEMGMLPEEIIRLSPKEIILLTDNSGLAQNGELFNIAKAEKHYSKITSSDALLAAKNLYPNEHKSKFQILPELTLKTLGILAEHLMDTQKCSLSHLSYPKEYRLGDGMVLDEATLGNLELLPTATNKNIGGTLFEVLNRTKTSMGARMFKKWLLKPLLNAEAINKRLDMVECFVKDSMLRAETRELLKNITDIERLLTKVTLGAKNPRDLQSLGFGLSKVPDLIETLKEKCPELEKKFIDQKDLTDYLDKYLLPDLPPDLTEGGYINNNVNEELDQLRMLIKNGDSWLKEFEEKQRQLTGIKTLKIDKNDAHGYFINIPKSQINNVPENYLRKQTLTTSERYITPELKEYESRATTAKDKSIALEKQIYDEVVKKVLTETTKIKQNAEAIAITDVLCSMATKASETSSTRPIINNSNTINIKGGRHPVVEKFLEKGEFTPNDITLDEKNRQAIITGPNMAGKSTYLRQTALIVLMAQAGCFVPAEHAEIGIVDRIFTRVGASDNLVRGQSTFMVEMMEAAAILKNATSKSLLILDEIGRGTSTFDGLSIAWSILEHIGLKIKARTMFATHYHELTDLENVHKSIFNLNIIVGDDKKTGNMVFLHKIEKGAASQSYGIEVAKLAGLPEKVIERAKEILFELEKTDKNDLTQITRSFNRKKEKDAMPIQLSLFTPDNELVEAVKAIDINNITPLEALNTLQKLKEIASGQ